MGGVARLNYLLDTHVWIWAALEPNRLSARARAALEDPDNLRLISPVSCWEATMLQKKGRLELPTPAESWIKDALSAPGIEIAPLTCDIAAQAACLPDPFHGDPADRFLVSTARASGIPLITADARILDYRHAKSLW